mgnify:CR=1 FL=1
MAFTAADVKKLREMTNVGMMDCKKALVEADGDMDKAVDVLRTRGIAKSLKKAGRATNEGAVMAFVSEDGKTAAIAEIKCETDFVSGTDKFKNMVAKVAEAAALSDAADVEAIIANGIATMGENMTLTRFARRVVENGAVASYIHMGGKIGVLVEFELGNAATAQNDEFKTLAHDVAMQVAATKPLCAVREDMNPEVVEHELAIYREQAAASGKPEAIQEKMAQGRVEKFYKENTLVDQEFVKNPDVTISQYVASVAKAAGDTIAVKGFDIFVLGE